LITIRRRENPSSTSTCDPSRAASRHRMNTGTNHSRRYTAGAITTHMRWVAAPISTRLRVARRHRGFRQTVSFGWPLQDGLWQMPQAVQGDERAALARDNRCYEATNDASVRRPCMTAISAATSGDIPRLCQSTPRVVRPVDQSHAEGPRSRESAVIAGSPSSGVLAHRSL
jgi:hypothetical protein